MQWSNLPRPFIAFLAIWTLWSIWTSFQPVLTSSQLATLFLFLPLSALLLAFSLFDDEDDDDFGGGIMQPILQKARPQI